MTNTPVFNRFLQVSYRGIHLNPAETAAFYAPNAYLDVTYPGVILHRNINNVFIFHFGILINN